MGTRRMSGAQCHPERVGTEFQGFRLNLMECYDPANQGGYPLPKKSSRPAATKQIQSVRLALSHLNRALLGLSRELQKAPVKASPAQGEKPVRRPLKLSAKRKAQLKLQGQYMGYMRQLKPRQKAEVKALKEKQGFEAALKKAKGMMGR